jgi:thiamine pyrophosphate-dependent acetolactate synthase large subunit-like protein
MPIKHVLLNNGELAKISKEQRSAHLDVWQTRLVNPSFAAYAELCGALGLRVERPDELDDALGALMAHDGPALLEVVQDPRLV